MVKKHLMEWGELQNELRIGSHLSTKSRNTERKIYLIKMFISTYDQT